MEHRLAAWDLLDEERRVGRCEDEAVSRVKDTDRLHLTLVRAARSNRRRQLEAHRILVQKL